MADLVSVMPGRPPIAAGAAPALLRRVPGFDAAALRSPALRRLLPVAAGAALIAVLLAAAMMLRGPTRVAVFPGLADADKAAVADALKTGGFNVAVDPETGDVQVPQADLFRARIALAGQGLPKAVPAGYDLLKDMPLGASQNLERARLKQASETELARAIQGMGGVAGARVMLALPDPSPFIRDAADPSASVFVTLLPGRALGQGQVRAIQHLVASSVPGLPPERVSVVDGAGTLLSGEDGDAGGAAGRQLGYEARLERGYRDRIAELLTPVVGPGNYTAQVHADLDFTEEQATTETYAPGNSAVRSEATSSRSDTNQPAKGVPGALSNLAPPAPSVGSAPPPPAPPPATPTNTETSATKNYEVGRAVAVTRRPVGTVKRIAVAVVLRDGAAGGKPADLKAIEALVTAAVGADPARGDVVRVVRQPFASAAPVDAVPMWRDLLDRHAGHLVALLAVIAAALLGMRALRSATPQRPARALTPIAADIPAGGAADESAKPAADALDAPRQTEPGAASAIEDEARRAQRAADILTTASTHEDKLAAIRAFAEADPARAAAALRRLLQREAA